PCAPVEQIGRFLPEAWPMATIPTISAEERWYVVWLSGRDGCTLNFTPASKSSQFPYRLAVASAQCDTVVSPSGLQVNARFQLAKPPVSGSVRVQLDEPLHVRSVFVDGVQVSNWKSIPGEDRQPDPQNDANRPSAPRAKIQVIEVACNTAGANPLVVAVEAIGRIPLPFDGPLPRVEIADSYVMDGRCTLVSKENVQIEDARCAAHLLSTSSQGGYANWQWQWTGRAPAMVTRLRTVTNQWTVRALTRLNLQSDVVVASVHVNVSSQNVQGNQVSLKLVKGWFVDSVEVENAPLGISANVVDTSDEASELNVRWEERRSDLDVRIIIKAHYHQRTDVDSLRLQASRIVTLPGADQVDTYVIESSGRFQLEIDPELLRLRVREDDLIPWQRELLPRLGDAWIFRGGRVNLPTVRLQRTRATLETRLHTTVTQAERDILITYRVVCLPISGSINQLQLKLPIPQNVVAPTWSLATPLASGQPSGLVVSSRATSSSAGETTFTIDVSPAVSEEFQIQAELRLDAYNNPASSSDNVVIPLPSVPLAVRQDAVVVVPQTFTLPEELTSVEILPSGLCCNDGHLMEAALTETTDVMAARYDPNVLSQLTLTRQFAKSRGGWAHGQRHEHWQHHAGRTVHRTSWDLALPTAQWIDFRLPSTWDFQSLIVDGQVMDVGSPVVATDSQRLRVRMPSGNHLSVQLNCTGRHLNAWPQTNNYAEPSCGLPALQTQRMIWFPPGALAGEVWPASRPASWSDRFWPQAWWQLLGFDPWAASGQAAGQASKASQPSADSTVDGHPVLAMFDRSEYVQGNWWALALTDSQAQVWTIDRTLAGSIMLCTFLIMAVVIYLACGTSLTRWWWLGTLLGLTLCLVPMAWLLPFQLLTLATVAAALMRLSQLVILCSRPVNRRSDSVHSGRVSMIRTGTTGLGIWLLLTGITPSTCYAQPLLPAPQRERKEIFGILIPVDDQSQVAGEYVYVPPRLYGLLSNSKPADTKNAVVSVSAAYYSFSITNDPVGFVNSVGDITVELTVQSTRADTELRLPFLKNELLLQRAFLDSQTMTVGDRVRQEADAIWWRAADTERHTMRLVLRPRSINQKDGRGSLSLTIPAIPTARLDVLGDDLREVMVEAVGGMQLESIRSLTARLGPTNRLSFSWPLTINRSALAQVQSDTWIHSRGEQLMALCQLRFRGASALPAVLPIVGDNNWVPVGQDWEGFRMLSADGASSLGRPVYSVERTSEQASDELTLRVLMLPRESTATANLSIPFLSPQQSAAFISRSLAISHTDSPQWKVIGTEAWQPQLSSQAAQLWDKSRLAERPTLWKVPSGSVQASLQRTVPAALPLVDETTEINLHFPEVKLKYAARWTAPVVGVSAVRLHVPSGMRVDSVFVDSRPARYALNRIAIPPPKTAAVSGTSPASAPVGPANENAQPPLALNELVVFIDSSMGGMFGINLNLSMPTRLNRPWRIPRPLLLEADVKSSLVQVYRGAELSGALQPISQPAQQTEQPVLEIRPVDVRPSLLLQELHTAVGQVELGSHFRDLVELPLEVQLVRSPTARSAHAVLRLTRSEQGWRAQFDAAVDVKDGEVNHVFFDLPRSLEASLREPLDANVPIMLWPSADSNRAILCVLPQKVSQDKARITFSFRLPTAGASQSITVPDIRMLGLATNRPTLALPTTLAGEPVRWTRVGRQLSANWLRTHGLEYLDLQVVDGQGADVAAQLSESSASAQVNGASDQGGDDESGTRFTLHEPGGNQLQAVWHARDDQEQVARILLTTLQLTSSGPSPDQRSDNKTAEVRGEVGYWIEPRNQSYLSIQLPSPCQLVGVEANDHPMAWSLASADRVRILLQPSYLPLRLRLLVRWPDVDTADSTLVQLPLPNPEAQNSGQVLIGQTSGRAGQTWPVQQSTTITSDEIESTVAQVWATTLVQAAPTAADRAQDELVAWLPAWKPTALGLNANTLVSVRKQFVSESLLAALGNSANGSNDEVRLSVADFWADVCQRQSLAQSMDQLSVDRGQLSDMSDDLGDLSMLAKTTLREWEWVRIPGASGVNQLTLQAPHFDRPTDLLIQLASAAAWLLASVVLWNLGRRWWRSRLQAVVELVWPLWLLLAVAAGALLPVVWPSLIVGFCLMVVLVRRYRQLRHDRQFHLLPKALR
ncbi:MAG: hypothetical protein IT423_05515, partial [Pirellulaceae bacterium]|nr:hypothetical protein [Pirellulaceae bacterium]